MLSPHVGDAIEDKGRVLVVDDTPTNLLVLDKLLTCAGYEVTKASSGLAAIEMAIALSPDVILLDIMMPHMDGYEVCTRLRAHTATAGIPIIFLSALDAPLDKVQAFSYGAADYVTKPFQPEEVLVRVRNQLNLQVAQQQQQQRNSELESRVQERTQLLELAHNQLLEVALTDRLTRLPNRLSFVKRLSKAMAQARLYRDRAFAVMFLDCDRFKRVNDSLGHRIGDQLLKGLARRLVRIEQAHPTIDMVARFGGDEFAILLSGVADREAVVAIADAVLQSLARPFLLAGNNIFIDASIGLVWGESTYVAAENMLRDADVAMYKAKDCSQRRYCWFESDMHSRAVHLLQLETDMRLALERREFELHYQPIVSLETMKIVGFEALVRWQHPTKGLIPPNEFIRFAEETGLIVELGTQILEIACRNIARWESQGVIDEEMTVSVNMAAEQLLQPDILEQVKNILEASGVAPYRLRLELTERSIISNHDAVDELLRAFQKTGIQLSIDDFGTGYSSLSYLHTLPVNCLKVDRSFVHPITHEESSLGIVPLIINMAETMNMQVIAEGIENITQLRQLQQLGCKYGQGFLFQKALPADTAISLVDKPFTDWPEAASA
ncbi:MAG: EAL domain-containing protein [Cyanobacteria bacterium J06614_10]